MTDDHQQRAQSALAFIEAHRDALLAQGALGIEVFAPLALSDEPGAGPALGCILEAIQLQLPTVLTRAEAIARFHSIPLPVWEDDGS